MALSVPFDISALNRRRGNIKSQITKMVSAEFDPQNEAGICARLECVEKLQLKLEEIKLEYYANVKDEHFEEAESHLSVLDEELQNLEVSAKTLLHEIRLKKIPTTPIAPTTATTIIPSVIENENVSVRLPAIPLPIYSGKLDEWSSFKTQFKSLIDDNPKLSENQKLFYLRASLKGDVRFIESLEDTYDSLFQALQDRYENKRAIIDTHIKNIINYERQTHESGKDLRNFIDCIKRNLRALKVLNLDRDSLSDALLINIISQKLHHETRRQYELTLTINQIPVFDDFISFLEKRVQIIDSVQRNIWNKSNKTNFDNFNKSRSLFIKTDNTTNKNNNSKCKLCYGPFHPVYKCELYLKQTPQERFETVRKHRLCYNCLSRSHSVTSCESKQLCSVCKAKHHTTIHKADADSSSNISSNVSSPNQSVVSPHSMNTSTHAIDDSHKFRKDSPVESASASVMTSCFFAENKKVLLATADVFIKDVWGNYVKGRAILDTGSQIHAVTNNFANLLGFHKKNVNVSLIGLNGCSIKGNGGISTTISNRDGSFSAAINLVSVSKITDLMPSSYVNVENLEIPSHVTLADPMFYKPSHIDLLLGNELFFQVLRSGKICLSQSLTLQETVFGFVIGGAIEGRVGAQHCGVLVTQPDNLENLVKRFWEIEAISDTSCLKSKEEVMCEEHFIKTHKRGEDGKYIVALPMKENVVLGSSMHLAKNRLNNLWYRLDKNPELAVLYSNFIHEYESLGHMRELKGGIVDDSKYVMPHHGIWKADSSTTKLRVVFDASAPSTTGVSLNQCLLNGGIVQEELFSILLHFRKHKFAFSADVKKMYRNIWVVPEQCHLQYILWKEGASKEMKLYELLTLTYGTKIAPYLAMRVLKQLALDEKEKYPLASAAALTDFYVDDILTGSDTFSTASELQQQLIEMFRAGGMELHKFCANDKKLLEQVPFNDQEYHFGDSDKETVKTLGLRWNPKQDNFGFTVSPGTETHTKRSVLSEISRLFDPLGYLGPVIVQAKTFLQGLWHLKIEWDQELPFKEGKFWEGFMQALPALEHVKIDRYILMDFVKEVQLHGFADASKDAYGAVVYIRCISVLNGVKVSLLCSKSRVAPLKVLTIPRLELCAAELLSKLMSKIVTSLKLEINRVCLYTDSSIVLAWIESPPHSLKIFVGNRVSRIQELTSDFQWYHVKTDENPADMVSRGMSPDKIVGNQMWFNGPNFLHQEAICDFNEHSTIKTDKHFNYNDEHFVKEFKKTDETTLNVNISNSFWDHIVRLSNNYFKLIRILSFVCRYTYNSEHPRCKRGGPLSTLELQEAAMLLLRAVQEEEFASEINSLKKSNTPTGKVRNLNPFLDAKNLMRVGGRLQNCNIGEFQRHPIILPAKHRLTEIIIESFHLRYFHIGPQNLLYIVRREFWPLNGRNICRKVVYKCTTCFRARPRLAEQIMGNLPSERVNRDFVFNQTGVDLCGPFWIKYRGQRKGVYHKIYVCTFVCMVSKAVHLDIVCDLTSEAFIATLKRFFARRGKAQTMFSDNAKNFVGTNVELKKLHQLLNKQEETLANYLASEGVQWKFILPKSPNFGGLWESGVRAFKHHFKRVVGECKLTYEEFLTIATQIEGILNSRPLTPLSADIDDLEVLTPGHFLIGRPITAVAEPNLTEVRDNRLNMWRMITKMTQIIWKKWQNNYLNNLQERQKWRVVKGNIKIGDMVILKEDNMPTCHWLLGRIIEVFLGKDKRVRVVRIKTKNGIYKRSISKVAILPLEN